MSLKLEKSQDGIPFPYKPYPQQQELMDLIYECISSSKVGLFESPTGIYFDTGCIVF